MKIRGLLITANCLLLSVVFFCVFAWIFSTSGINYFAMLSRTSINLFYFTLSISILYSAYLCYLLLSSKRRGARLVFYWNIFLGLCILVPWIGGYALLKYKYGVDIVIEMKSSANLLKAVLSFCLIALGLTFKSKRVALLFSA